MPDAFPPDRALGRGISGDAGIVTSVSRLLTGIGLLCGLLFGVLSPQWASADEEPAGAVGVKAREGIEVEGNRRIEPATVRSYFKPAVDGRIDEAARDAGLKALIATNLFDKISIERKGERLIVHLHEAPVIERVAFEGNHRLKDADLSSTIESKPRSSLQRALVQSDVAKIVEAYKHLGRDDVAVKPVIIDHGSDRVDLVFEVNEGKKTPVMQINFVGNTAFGKRQLAAVIKTSATNMLSFLVGGDVYDPDLVNADRERLRNYYRNRGYADVSVRAASVDLGSDGHLVNGVLPGVLDTPMTRANLSVDQIATVTGKSTLGRLPDLATLAETILFLCSPANNSITGQSIAVDLGMSNANLL